MSWEQSYAVVAEGVTPEAIWDVWKDVDHWHLWDADIEFARLKGPFEAGSKFVLKPKGGPTVNLQFIEVKPLTSYTDFTTFPFAKMYGIHTMRPTGKGLEIACCIRVTGPLAFVWRKLVAEGVARGLERQTQELIAHARVRKQSRIES